MLRVEDARVDSASNPLEVTRDDQRFPVNMLRPGPTASGITVVLNWTAALPR